MKIYTRTGDGGETGLFGGARIHKDDPRVEAYGTVDELNAALGVAREALDNEHTDQRNLERALAEIQGELFVLGAEVACVPGTEERLKMSLISAQQVERLEQLIDRLESSLPPLTTFILPGGSRAGAALHLARTIARRAERRSLSLRTLRPEVIIYLNRLSDCLFVMARSANQACDATETPWQGRGSKNA